VLINTTPTRTPVVFPHISSDKEFHTDIFVLNTTGAVATFSLVFHTDTGATLALDGNPPTRNVNLAPNGVAFFRISPATTANEGWAERDSSAPLSGVVVYGRHGTDSKVAPLKNPSTVAELMRTAHQNGWVVYAKRPFGGAEYVVHYLGRYTHRVAISSHRLVSLEDHRVTFRWRG
jgi:hypothetical protein